MKTKDLGEREEEEEEKGEEEPSIEGVTLIKSLGRGEKGRGRKIVKNLEMEHCQHCSA